MDSNKDKTIDGSQTSNSQSDGLPAPATSQDGEFKIEVPEAGNARSPPRRSGRVAAGLPRAEA